MKSGKHEAEHVKKENPQNTETGGEEKEPIEAAPETGSGTEEALEEHLEKTEEQADDSVILELNNEIARLNELVARERAEFINYRKRTAQESLQLEGRTAGKILQEILPAFDAFDQLLASSHADAGSMTKFLEGAALIKKQLWQVFENLGVEELDPLNLEFDPQIMEALSVLEAEDANREHVVQVYQKGYRYKDRVLRPARVGVKKPKMPAGEEKKE